jgi:hypothetical protein
MKKIIFVSLLVITVTAVNAQYQKKEGSSGGGGFKKENLFTGGSLEASFYNGGTVLGISPYFGYSLNRFVDVAASFGFSYTSQRDYYVLGDKLRQTDFGPGAFVRLYPFRFLFAQGGYEHNFITQKYLAVANSGYMNTTSKLDDNSVLVGGGICSGREGVGSPYFYFSVLWDVSGNLNSPYVDGLGRSVPILKAGIQIPLFQGDGGGGFHHHRRD